MFGLLTSKHPGPCPTQFQPDAGGAWAGGAPDGGDRLFGFAEGTRVATMLGWRAVESLAIDDLVLTFDNGPQPIRAMTRGRARWSGSVDPAHLAPIEVPGEVLGNRAPLRLMPEQVVMFESDIAEVLTGDPFALVPATALVGYRGVQAGTAAPGRETVTLHFAADEIIYAEGGALVLSPAALPGDRRLDLNDAGPATPYIAYSGAEARALIAALMRDDVRHRSAAPAAA